MIITRLMGGLGNQMFQYAFGKYLSERNNTELLIDTTLLKDRKEKEYSVFREFDLDIFDINFKYVSKKTIFNYGCIDGYFINKILRKIKQIFKKPNVVIQHNHDFDINHLTIGNNTCIVGRWQSYKYFEGINVKDLFKFKENLLEKNVSIRNQIIHTNSVAIHFRRGDYVSNKFYAKKIGALDISYYIKAIALIKDKVEKPIFFIFSDDIKWVKKNLVKDIDNVFFIEQDKNKRGMKDDLQLMSICKNHIISNSTFAWWGAYLANSNMVIAPKQWAKAPEFIPPYIYPENWITI